LDKLGRIPERKSVEVKVIDWPVDNRYIISGWEMVGFGLHNTGGISAAKLTWGSLQMPARYPLS
jgi:hypothetical protein